MTYKEKYKKENEMTERLATSVARNYLLTGCSVEEPEVYGKRVLLLARQEYDPFRGWRFTSGATWLMLKAN